MVSIVRITPQAMADLYKAASFMGGEGRDYAAEFGNVSASVVAPAPTHPSLQSK